MEEDNLLGHPHFVVGFGQFFPLRGEKTREKVPEWNPEFAFFLRKTDMRKEKSEIERLTIFFEAKL